MRKKKENISRNANTRHKENIPDFDAIETAREEDFEAATGETATEAVGQAFDTSDEFDDVRTADGPASGIATDPPHVRRGSAQRRRKKKSPHPEEWRVKGNHIAARSSKKL
jgi:hypothetical protein